MRAVMRLVFVRRCVTGVVTTLCAVTTPVALAADFGSNTCEGLGCFNGGGALSGADRNSGFGQNTLHDLISSDDNTAVGYKALYSTSNNPVGGNTAIGVEALFSNLTGYGNVASGMAALYKNDGGAWNVATGFAALYSNTGGHANVATGWSALYDNTLGYENTATGASALTHNTTGRSNVANGNLALAGNIDGFSNVAVGHEALRFNTSGDANVAVGSQAAASSQTASPVLAIGAQALQANTVAGNLAVGHRAAVATTTGGFNVAIGPFAFEDNTAGHSNLAVGYRALSNSTTGNWNAGIGRTALESLTGGNSNFGLGLDALRQITTGSGNVAIGVNAGENLTGADNNNILLDNLGTAGDARRIRIGTPGTHTSAFVAGIHNQTAAGGLPVYVDSTGKLGTSTSSSRALKTAIRSIGGSAVLDLDPVSYRYKTGGPRRYGLIAEDVARTLPLLASYDDRGKPTGIYYEQLSTLLLAQLKREHARGDRLERRVARLETQDRK